MSTTMPSRPWDSPAAQPPPGQTSNLHESSPSHDWYWILSIIFGTITAVLITVRLFTRHWLSKGLKVEDYMIVLAWLFQLVNIIGADHLRGIIGHHVWNITFRESMKFNKTINIISIIYDIETALMKVAILLQYIRIFTSHQANKSLRFGCWFFIIVIGLYYTIDTFLCTFQCVPREMIWNPFYEGDGHCMNIFDIWFATGMFNTLTDVAVLILPLPAIAKLQMPLRKRLFIIAIFATGSFACAASAIRTYYTYVTLYRPNTDETFYMYYVAIWVWVEMFIGITVFCLPTVPKFYLFADAKTRSIYATSSSSFSSFRKGSKASIQTMEEERQTVADALSPSTRLPFTEVSLASFEQRPPASGERKDIHVMRSVSQVVEEERGSGDS